MKATLDMKTIQNMNLFEKITRVKPRCCFDYNQIRFFVVPRLLVKKSLGEKASNLSRLEPQIARKIRVIAEPEKKTQEEIENFIKIVIFPYEFKRIEIVMNECEPELHIYSMPKIKAALIGRNKQRLQELSQAMEQFFNIKKVLIK
jgi:hypothetical protein